MFESNYLFQENIEGRLTDLSLANMRLAKEECEREILHAIDLFHERTGLRVESVHACSKKYGLTTDAGGIYQEEPTCAKVIVESI